MIVSTTFVLLAISIIAIVVLFVLKFRESSRLDEEWFYPLGRLNFVIFGIAVFLLGFCFYQRSWPFTTFFSPLFLVFGVQITFWAIGITSEYLGNTTPPSSTIDRRWVSYYEEYDIQQRYEALMHEYNELKHNVQQSSLELITVKAKNSAKDEAIRLRNFCRAINNHLFISISILEYSKNAGVDKVEEMRDKFRNEINEILLIIKVNTELSTEEDLSEIFEPFLQRSGEFLYDPLEKSSKMLDVLYHLGGRLKEKIITLESKVIA